MFKHGFPPEWSTFKKLIWLVGSGIAGAASGIWKTVSGSLIHITDALASPMQKCEVSLEPIQDLHGQDAPYPAGGGVNKLPVSTNISGSSAGITATFNADGSVHLSGTAASRSNITLFLTQNFVKAGEYILSISDVEIPGVKLVFGGGGSTSGMAYTEVTTQRVVTATSDGDVGYHIIRTEAGTTVNATIYPMLRLSSVEDGTWSPYSNICPITGWTGCEVTRTGKNLLNLNRTLSDPVPTDISNTTSPRVFDTTKFYNGARSDNYYYANYVTTTIESGTVSVTLNAGNNSYGAGFPVSVKGGNTYTFSADFTSGYFSFGYYDASWNYISGSIAFESNATVTVPSDAAFMLIVLRCPSPGTTITFKNLQLELGSTATDYEPYSGTTLSVTFPDSAGTVYGGTVDVVSGVLTVDRKKRTITSFDGAWGSANNGYAAYINSTLRALNLYIAKCNQFKKSSMGYMNMPLYSYFGGSGAPITWTFILPSSVTSLAQANEWLSNLDEPLEIIYALGTPIKIQLTPQQISTLAGENNVWSNGDSVEITYKAQA